MKKPMGDRVIVKPNSAIKVSEGGMELPQDSVEKPQEGTAVAVGKKCEEVKEGMKVTYGAYSGKELEIDGEEYLIMKESEIIAVE